MQVGRLALAGAILALLGGCASDVNPFSQGRAGPPESLLPGSAAPAVVPPAAPAVAVAPPADMLTGNRELAAFLGDNLDQMRKYPRALRIAAVIGSREMDLKSWPGSIVVAELQSQASACGTPVSFVKLSDDFDLLVGFSHQEKDGRLDVEDYKKISAPLARNRLRAAQSLSDILDVELEVRVDNNRASAKGQYPFDRWHRFLAYDVPENAHKALLPRLPVETWRENFDRVIAEIAPTVPDSEAKRTRVEEFRTRYLDEVMAICPNNFYASLMNHANVNAQPDLVMAVLRDDRVQAGMKRDEFADATLIILNRLRPGK